MELKDTLLKTFAKAMQTPNEKETALHYATVKDVQTNGNGKKKIFVSLDGSDPSVLTPVVEGTQAMINDRVMVTIENHKAVIMNNVTSPATGRTESSYMDLTNDGLLIGEITNNSHPYRVLIRPTSIDLLNGSDLLSRYGGSSITFYIPGSNPLTAAASIGSDGLAITKGSINLGNNFIVTSAGAVTIKSGSITLGSNFSVTSTGVVTINSGSITLGSNFSVTSAGVVTINSGSINLGNNFIVTSAGAVTIKSGSITLGSNFSVTNAGVLTASSGTIGPWVLSTSGLYYPNLTTQNAVITGTYAKFGNGIGYVRVGHLGNAWGMDSSDDYAMTIGNGVTWLVLGVNGEWLRPDDSGAQNLGTSDYKWKTIYATNGTIQTSDAKDKDVLGELDNELASNLILNFKPITYMWKNGDHRRTRMGFIAQDIVKTCKSMNKNLALFTASYKVDPALGDDDPNMVRDYFGEDVDDAELTWGLSYSELIAPLVKVVQMQHDNIQELKTRVTELEERLNG